MSKKKWFALGIGIIAVALIVSLTLVHLGLADDLYNGAADLGGPAWAWIVESYHGIANSSFAQTYIAPPWHAFGFGCLFIGIIALVLWKKPVSLHWPWKKTTPKVQAMEFQREPAEPETTPKTKVAPEPSPTPSTEESAT